MATAALQIPTDIDERYEVAKARVDLLEAEAELAQCVSEGDRAMARQRVEEARCRIVRWRRAEARDDAPTRLFLARRGEERVEPSSR
jgi:hypothetical protein